MGQISNLKPWAPGQSGNPLGRRSDKTLVDHVLASTRDGAELGDLLLDIARKGKRDCDRIDACDVLLDRCFGKIAPADRDSLLGTLTRGAGAIQFSAVFGPRDRAPGVESTDEAVEVEAVEVAAHRVDTDAPDDAESAETPVESPESPESPEIVEINLPPSRTR
jgi:hypothetical protein